MPNLLGSILAVGTLGKIIKVNAIMIAQIRNGIGKVDTSGDVFLKYARRVAVMRSC
jgi:hypothetical protein